VTTSTPPHLAEVLEIGAVGAVTVIAVAVGVILLRRRRS